MAALPALRPVAIVAAANSAVQGLAGGVLSVLALCVCFCALGTAPVTTNDNDLAQYLTYYLQGDECGAPAGLLLYPSTVTGPAALRLWVVLSLFFNATMLVSSLALLLAVSRHWSDEKLQITLVSWLFINMFTAVDDLILGYVFLNDYNTAVESTSQHNNLGPLTIALVGLVAVRGLYLWLLNVALIVYLFTGARALHKYLGEQMAAQVHEPIDSWLRVDDFAQTKAGVAHALSVERDQGRAPPAVNTGLVAHRIGSPQPEAYPEYTALARWPALTRGVDNPAYEPERPAHYLRLDREHEAAPGVVIPPVDYLDELQPRARPHRPLSLQEAILDRTVRLKKVPDELKRGFQK